MRLVSYSLGNDSNRMGCMVDDKIVDLHKGFKRLLEFKDDQHRLNQINDLLPEDPATFYLKGDKTMALAYQTYEYVRLHKTEFNLLDRKELTLQAPIPKPGKIICVGKNYADHATEMDSDIPDIPVLFAKFDNSIIGPEDCIEKSPLTNKLDYEVELAVVIGKETSHISKAEADDYIAGYMIANDSSARDMQKQTPQWLQGKSHDRSMPIGPWLVTSDEITSPNQLSIRSYVNGEKRQDSNTSKLIFGIDYLLEFISGFMTLTPGDIILTGTPNGVGAGMTPPTFLEDGDWVTLEIEEIGEMTNKVIAGE